ncbi:hypothetical protein [Flavobacterium aquicola]|uniref:YD repeat-containing protein n=1 Tax=Flavobacterium aquicola TaxID=1682742 RepID=A0A3E0EK70_9FLAO|nr:hypothetical protein [Flavobacterium aquicola]REG98644.1 hypothetical protein C8P67_106256 [Flavobacterium aquicola]
MKKFSHFLLALILVLISSCSSDDSSSDSGNNLVLPKTISMTFPGFPSDNSKEVITYDGNKILTSVDEDSKTVFTYDGNFIVKQVKFDLGNKGEEIKDTEVLYTYENGKLKTRMLKKGFSTEYPNGQYIYKTVYTHNAYNQVTYVYYVVDAKTNMEVKDHQGILNYKDGNLVKEEFIVTNDQRNVRSYEYDDKNDPLKNILGFNLLLNEVNCGNNNIIKTISGASLLNPFVYIRNYIYSDNGYPTKMTSYTSDGKTIEYITEYTY